MCTFDAPILLVEDATEDAILFERALRKSAIRAIIMRVADGDAAIDYLKGTGHYSDREIFQFPALVVLDLKLPRRSGFEVLEWIRTGPRPLSQTPVVVLSSSNNSSDVEQAYAKGANAYVTKPFTSPDYADMAEALASFWLRYNEQGTCPKMNR